MHVELNLVVFCSRNLAAARAFYERLGLTFQLEQHGNGPQHLAAELGSTVFEIYPAADDTNVGELRVGFRVASVDDVVAELRSEPRLIISEPRDSAWGRRAVLHDPDGNRVELTQREDWESIQRGLADRQQGNEQPLAQADLEMRKELGFPPT